MKKIRLAMALALGLMMIALEFGCGGGESAPAPTPPAPTKPKKDKLAPKGPSAPSKPSGGTGAGSPNTLSKLAEWQYNPETKWDPFVQPEVTNTDPPIKSYDIDQMLLYGVVRGSGMDRAFIRLPDNSDQIIKVGDILGKHNGRVTRIESDAIVVEEKYFDPNRPNEIFVINKKLPLVKLSK